MKIPSRLQRFDVEIRVTVTCPICGDRHISVEDEPNWTKALQKTEDAIKRHCCCIPEEEATW